MTEEWWRNQLLKAEAERDALRQQLDEVGSEMELAQATLRGWRDFFSGQPKDMPFTEPGVYAKNSQLNFWWTVGYESAQDSELFKLMVGRADRSAERSQKFATECETLRQQLAEQAQVDNGNTFVFCDHVEGRMGCVRGAGHDGPHALCHPPYPQGPVILADALTRPSAPSGEA